MPAAGVAVRPEVPSRPGLSKAPARLRSSRCCCCGTRRSGSTSVRRFDTSLAQDGNKRVRNHNDGGADLAPYRSRQDRAGLDVSALGVTLSPLIPTPESRTRRIRIDDSCPHVLAGQLQLLGNDLLELCDYRCQYRVSLRPSPPREPARAAQSSQAQGCHPS
jgi:hypothetical protein